MDLYTYYRSLSDEQRIDLARRCDVSPGHLRNCAYGSRVANEKLAIDLERESAGEVLAHVVRPDCKTQFDYLRNSGETA